jgi:hypothetical protein
MGKVGWLSQEEMGYTPIKLPALFLPKLNIIILL